MRISGLAAGLAAALFSSSAFAHPGAALLTVNSKNPAAAMSGGVRFEDAGGVHVFRGGGQTKAGETELLGGEKEMAAPQPTVIICYRPYRQFRRLRTQGFYSGDPYPSRRYRQGFYSSRR